MKLLVCTLEDKQKLTVILMREGAVDKWGKLCQLFEKGALKFSSNFSVTKSQLHLFCYVSLSYQHKLCFQP